MAGSASDSMDEGHLDLVPMIDCIMLLLLFFMMTTKFTAEEKAISSLLPTDKGQAAAPQKQTDPPQLVNISIYPAGMTKGFQPSDYLNQLNKLHLPGQVISDAVIRIGNREPITIPGRKLAANFGEDVLVMQRLIDQIHLYIADELTKFEKAGQPRNKQNDIIINCFSGLSWKFPLIVYDGVRAYEGKAGNIKYTGDPAQLLEARAVTFSPPRIRDYTANELGNELYEIIHTK
jgi:hypothetical protein